MDLATALTLVSTIAIVCSGVFAGIQVRNAQKQRSCEAAYQLIRSILSPESEQWQGDDHLPADPLCGILDEENRRAVCDPMGAAWVRLRIVARCH